MPIVGAAVVPHSPLLLPAVAKDHASLLHATAEQLRLFTESIYAAQPTVIAVLTPHGPSYDEAIVVQTADVFHGGFTEFGDVRTTIEVQGALGLTHQLKTVAEREHVPLLLQTFPELDYGTSVPLTYLLQPQPKLAVMPISVPYHTPELLLRAGGVLHDFFSSSSARGFIVASCDFTRRKERSAEAHRRPTNEERQLSAAIVSVNPAMATAVTPQSATCGYGPLVTLLSAIQGLATTGTVTSFEAPLGVGLLTARFEMNA